MLILNRRKLIAGAAALAAYAALPKGAEANFGAIAGKRDPWSPHVLTKSVLKGWWHAADLSAGAVTTWTDRQQGLAPTQATGGSKPVQAATSFNAAYPGVTFDGVDDSLRTVTNVALLPNGAAAGEIWALCQYLGAGATAGNKFIFTYGGTSGATVRQFFRGNNANVNRAVLGEGGSNLTDLSVDFSSPAILRGTFAGTTEAAFINGATFSTPTAVIASLNTGTAQIGIGCNPAQVSPGNIVAAEFIVTTALSTADAQRVEGYWAWNYGLTSILPASHPYKSMRP